MSGPYHIDIFEDDPDTREPTAVNVDLAEAFPEPDEYRTAERALLLQGQYWYGGGAAPAIFVCVHRGV